MILTPTLFFQVELGHAGIFFRYACNSNARAFLRERRTTGRGAYEKE